MHGPFENRYVVSQTKEESKVRIWKEDMDEPSDALQILGLVLVIGVVGEEVDEANEGGVVILIALVWMIKEKRR